MECSVPGCGDPVHTIYAGFALCHDCWEVAFEAPGDIVTNAHDLADYLYLLYAPEVTFGVKTDAHDVWEIYHELVVMYIRRTPATTMRDNDFGDYLTLHGFIAPDVVPDGEGM